MLYWKSIYVNSIFKIVRIFLCLKLIIIPFKHQFRRESRRQARSSFNDGNTYDKRNSVCNFEHLIHNYVCKIKQF